MRKSQFKKNQEKFWHSEIQMLISNEPVETSLHQIEPVCSSSFEFWMNRAFVWYTYTYIHTYIQNGNSNIFPKYGQSILTVSTRYLKFEFWQWIWSPHNNHLFLECVYMLVFTCIFPNRKKKLIFFSIITPLLVLTIFTPSFIIRSN